MQQEFERRTLARAVRAQKTEDAAKRDLARQAVEPAMRARPPESRCEVLGEAICTDRCRHDASARRYLPALRFNSNWMASSKYCGGMSCCPPPPIRTPLMKSVGVESTRSEAAIATSLRIS